MNRDSLESALASTWLFVFMLTATTLPAAVAGQDNNEFEILISRGEGFESGSIPGSLSGLSDVYELIKLREALSAFGGNVPLDGFGTTVAVIDSGLYIDHNDFAPSDERIPIQVECDLEGCQDGVAITDGSKEGHGTHVTGIIAAHGGRQGVAPAARIIPIRVFNDDGKVCCWEAIEHALKWVLDNVGTYEITAVNLSLGDTLHLVSDDFHPSHIKRKIKERIQELRIKNIPVIVAAGNTYYQRNNKSNAILPRQGMAFPAVVGDTISVGALYANRDNRGHVHTSFAGAASQSIVRYQIAPFSQRIHENLNPDCKTDIFAPGGRNILSTGIESPTWEREFTD